MAGLTRLRRLGLVQPRTGRDAADWEPTLFELSGRAPDDLLGSCWQLAAAGRALELAATLAFAMRLGMIALSERDLARIDAEFASANRPIPTALVPRPTGDRADGSEWSFRPSRTDPTTMLADLSGTPESVDDVDRHVVSAVQGEPSTIGLWRSWRTPPELVCWPAETRVFLVVVAPSPDRAEVTARLQNLALPAGERVGQVEVVEQFSNNQPAYHESLRAGGALLWARTPSTELQSARVFDFCDPDDGPGFAPDHPQLDGHRHRRRILRYLTGAPIVVATTGTMPDVLDPAGDVPLSFRSDGKWIWTDSVSYYLERHHLAPDQLLLDHLEESGDPPTRLDEVTMHRVLAALLQPTPAGEDGQEAS